MAMKGLVRGRGDGGWECSGHREQPCTGSVAGTCAEHLKNRKKPGVLGACRGQNWSPFLQTETLCNIIAAYFSLSRSQGKHLESPFTNTVTFFIGRRSLKI